MKKSQTNYYTDILLCQWPHDTYSESITLEIDEETKNHIKIMYYQDRWRTKEEFIQLFKEIIKELEKFKN